MSYGVLQGGGKQRETRHQRQNEQNIFFPIIATLRNETTSKLQARRDVQSLQILVPEQLESLFLGRGNDSG